MATLASLSEFSGMYVITTMATTARPAHLGAGLHRPCMACFALYTDMRPVDDKPCLAIVIKIPGFPVGWNVAKLALRAKLVFMNIVLKMASDTVLGCILKTGRLVAIQATGIQMCTDKRKNCQPMIEPNLISPAYIAMAFFTILAKLTFMGVVVPMTRIAFLLQ